MVKITAKAMPDIIAAMSAGYSVSDIARKYGVTESTLNRRVRSFIAKSPVIHSATKTVTTTTNNMKEDAHMSTIINNTISARSTSIVRTRVTPVCASTNMSGTIGKQEYIQTGTCRNGDKWVRCSMFVNHTNMKTGEVTKTIYNLRLWGKAANYFIAKGLKQGDLVRFCGTVSQSNVSKYADFNVNDVNEERGYGFYCECKRAIEAKHEQKITA